MKKRIKYTDQPMKLRVVTDFLPPPSKLRLKTSRVKVNLEVARETLDFYRSQSRGNGDYRRMMSQLLDLYAAHHGRRKTG